MNPESKILPFEQIKRRLNSSKLESDSDYFHDLLLLGEMLTKLVGACLVASIDSDKDRSKYRQEYKLVRANAIGDWAQAIIEMLDGVVSQYIVKTVREREVIELGKKSRIGEWQYESLQMLKNAAIEAGVDEIEEIPVKISLKEWFKYFTVFRNKTKGHGAITKVQASQAIRYLEGSIFLIIDNLSFFNRYWAYLYQNYSGKYRVSGITRSSAPFDFLRSSDESKGIYPNGVYIFLDEIRRVTLIQSNPELENFFFPNGNFRNERYEIISYSNGERKKANGADYITPIENLPKSETEGLGGLEVQGECFGNIPPRIRNYVSRKSIEPELIKVLKEKFRYPIITLVGKGGIGKTSLALTVLHEISNSGDFDIILWFSARDIDLMESGAKAVKAQILNAKDIALEFIRLLDVDVKEIDKKPEEYFTSIMSSGETDMGRILFVFDNFETVQNPLELFRWIDTFIRLPNKVLITSRESRDFKADYPIEVFKMDYDECVELIDVTAENLEISELLTNAYIQDLIQESNGHPYIIKILLGEVAKERRLPAKIARIVAGREDILLALFRRTYGKLSLSAKRVFLTLASWRSVIPQIALEAVLLRPENEERIDVEAAVEELRRCSLIDVAMSENGEVFIGVPLAASIFGKQELDVSPQKIHILDDRELLLEFGATKDADVKNGLKPRIERKFAAIGKKIESLKDDQKLLYLDQHLPTMEYLSRKFPEGWLLLAELYELVENIDGIKSSYNSFLKEKDITNEQRRHAWKKLAEIYQFQKDWKGESHALSEICLLTDTDFQDVSEAANRMNSFFKDNKEIDSEHKNLVISRIAEIMENRIAQEGYATDYSRLAWLYLNLKDGNKAYEIAQAGLAQDSDNEYCKRLIARLSNNLTYQ